MEIERRRGTPTADELRVWREYVETGERIRSAMAGAMQRRTGISSGDYAVLLALSEAEGRRLRSSALADAAHWERSRLSHHLPRMERRGLIRREDCATDDRGAEVVLSAEGLRVFRQASAAHFGLIRELFVDALTPEGLAQAHEVSAALSEHLRAR
ncbi:MarR family winged helix-turn-helix transcriptional regulator [Amnibacterium setariae]|nr:MarR family transcriptional regulator [Amnibacterium setariae]